MENKAKNSGSGQVFKNPILEKLTKTHISMPLIAFSAVSSYLIYTGSTEYGLNAVTIVLLFLAGTLAFTFVEYLMHRFLFHMPETTPARKKVVYTMHGVHHDHPKDKDRLAMPVPLSLTISFLFFWLFRFLMGEMVWGFLPGFLMGYAGYLWIHFMIHAFQPPKNFFKFFWVHHGIHHYKQPERAFGVTTPIWDLVFRTMPNK
ncbi:MAG: sterol desaturase family protein [Reichenbachiella sp.]|uniref:sterol desaturase family protein n=2 Tax=Reichenbachiella sp. TaxID=2184521 RepID=UPI003299FBE2